MRHEKRPELGSSRSCEGMDTEALSLFLTSLVRSLVKRGGGARHVSGERGTHNIEQQQEKREKKKMPTARENQMRKSKRNVHKIQGEGGEGKKCGGVKKKSGLKRTPS